MKQNLPLSPWDPAAANTRLYFEAELLWKSANTKVGRGEKDMYK